MSTSAWRSGTTRMHEPDPLLTVEATLTAPTKERWLARAFEMFPRLRGAKVADVLESLAERDAFLNLTEPWWGRAGDALNEKLGGESPFLTPAIYIAIVAAGASNNDPRMDRIAELVARAAAQGSTDAVVFDV
jgi:hypothetical protein